MKPMKRDWFWVTLEIVANPFFIFVVCSVLIAVASR